MRPSNLRRRLTVAATIGATSLIAILGVGVSSAGAATPIPDPATGYPSFNNGVIGQIRGSGSDTTFYMMQKISDLYTSAGLYGCTLNGIANQGLFNPAFVSTGTNLTYYCQGQWSAYSVLATSGSNQITLVSLGNFPAIQNGNTIQGVAGSTTYIPTGTTVTGGGGTATLTLSHNASATTPGTGATVLISNATAANPTGTANIDTTDTADNWSRTEVVQGVDNVGSGAGQSQLCGSPTPLNVDFSRSSSPAASCGTLVNAGFAKDAVPATDFRINPSAIAPAATTAPYSTINGGVLGKVASGWEPGDPVAGPNSGTQLSSINNNDGGATNNLGGKNSVAYRLWCASGGLATGFQSQITDWGQLTNLGKNLAVPQVVLNSTTTATVPHAALLPNVVGDVVTDLTTPGNIPASTTVTAAELHRYHPVERGHRGGNRQPANRAAGEARGRPGLPSRDPGQHPGGQPLFRNHQDLDCLRQQRSRCKWRLRRQPQRQCMGWSHGAGEQLVADRGLRTG